MSLFLTTGAASILLGLIWGEADLSSGPNVGIAVSSLNVSAVTGENAGQEVDLVEQRGTKPTLYVFVAYEKLERPLAGLLKSLEKEVINAGNDSAMFTLFMASDQALAKDHLSRIQMSLKFTANPLVVCHGPNGRPEAWLLNQDAQLTAIVVKEGKVTATFGYRQADAKASPEIIAALKRAIDPE